MASIYDPQNSGNFGDEVPKQHANPRVLDAMKRVKSTRDENKKMLQSDVDAMMAQAADNAVTAMYGAAIGGLVVGIAVGYFLFRTTTAGTALPASLPDDF